MFCNRKNGHVLKILNIMILLGSEYHFTILSIVFDEILAIFPQHLIHIFDQN
jgi:hypothetical protein